MLRPFPRVRSAMALGAVGLILCTAACTNSDDPTASEGPKVTVTAVVTVTAASPSPSESEPTDTAQAPFQAVVNLATVLIDGSAVEVAGYASGVIEDGGTCLYTLTSQSTGAVVTRESIGVNNVTNTSCGIASVPITELPRGTWSVTLTYTSTPGSVTSLPLTVEVP